MLLAALLLAAAPADAAERAFASHAQTHGQWTAFRAFAAPDAVSFGPELATADALFGTLKDPRVAVMWWPSRLIASCDDSLAVSTGPWARKGGTRHGSFTTVWVRQKDGGWKWRLDQGRDTPRAVPAHEPVRAVRASCARIARPPLPPLPAGTARLSALVAGAGRDVIVQYDGRMPASGVDAGATVTVGRRLDGGVSRDGTLAWDVLALDGAEPGAHLLIVRRFDGGGWTAALLDVTGVPS